MNLAWRHHCATIAPLAFSLILTLGGCRGAEVAPSSRPSPAPESKPAAADRIVKVLYVEGGPRWEYRYIKTALLHHPAVRLSCLLTSADPGYEQEASDPDPKIGFVGQVKAFPETAEALAAFDVIVFGDVDSRMFTDRQLVLLCDFVRKDGGGFAMIAGPRFAPISFRSTRISGLLPVDIDHVAPIGKDEQFSEGFHPVLTEAGQASPIFKGPDDPAGAVKSGGGLWEGDEPLFWYCQGVRVQVAAGEKPPQVLAVHPTAKAPDGNPALLLVLGQAGKGTVLFSAIDDSWRWRSAARPSAYADYWIAQWRALAPKQAKSHATDSGARTDTEPAK